MCRKYATGFYAVTKIRLHFCQVKWFHFNSSKFVFYSPIERHAAFASLCAAGLCSFSFCRFFIGTNSMCKEYKMKRRFFLELLGGFSRAVVANRSQAYVNGLEMSLFSFWLDVHILKIYTYLDEAVFIALVHAHYSARRCQCGRSPLPKRHMYS